jgi:protein-disulfide isomerase
MKRAAAWVVLAILSLAYTQPGFTQQPQQTNEELQALRKEIEALKQGQARIERELQGMKDLLRAIMTPRAAGPRDVMLTVNDDPWKGDKSAKLTLVEFSDYQ